MLASTRDVGPIYRVVAAFVTDDGRRVLLDRGWIPTSWKAADRPQVAAEVVGNLQWPRERDSYTPANDLDKNIWFARDTEAMAAALNTEPVMVILRETNETELVVEPLPVNGAAFPNDHLQYVVTWFGLAIVWVMMTIYYLFRMRKPRKGLMK